MEYFDAFTTFAAGISLGIIIGHWLRKQTMQLEYERGRLDGINLLWPWLVAAWCRELAARHRKPAGDPSAGNDNSA